MKCSVHHGFLHFSGYKIVCLIGKISPNCVLHKKLKTLPIRRKSKNLIAYQTKIQNTRGKSKNFNCLLDENPKYQTETKKLIAYQTKIQNIRRKSKIFNCLLNGKKKTRHIAPEYLPRFFFVPINYCVNTIIGNTDFMMFLKFFNNSFTNFSQICFRI